MTIVLFDNNKRKQLYPLTQTRAVADLQAGIFSIKEKWQRYTGIKIFIATTAYLQPLYAVLTDELHYWIDASVLPDNDLAEAVLALEENQSLEDDEGLIACKANMSYYNYVSSINSISVKKQLYKKDTVRINYCFDLFKHNNNELMKDYVLATKNKTSQTIASTNHVIHTDNIFIEEGAVAEGCFLNASEGQIYIGKNVLVMEGTCIRGPVAILKNAVIKMGAKIYGGTTIGKHCTAGGEIKNAILMNHSNKAHDGYLGDAVIGSWCNLGAGTSVSNIKNTAGDIMVYNYASKDYVNAGKKCGVIMGDYSRTAINTSINTGSVIGVCCNVFGNELLPKFLKDFSWSRQQYDLEKALMHINNWMQLKNQSLSSQAALVLKHIFEQNQQPL